MTATTITKAQKNLYQLVENVNDGYAPVIIVNENDDTKNAVLISEEEWNSIQETMYLYSIPGMVESIIEARNEPLSECKTYDPNEEW
ncbi:MAG: type II toxin-antitoxin system Phd/YefM family antitoxin [Synergistales bacterium]|nr:type II toxin-antitoxin system Phd/YefM family antitoxin [Synergistales bacterium]MDY6401900.1 type II toxin-antitoxin system Phd/YefM family antitoxin [Synergistales bacterium]MDY6403914.1 type II toxin-antitoxin system Phd/YefM family antitoxin [Synergistales bacterium]MDY6411288.1 type II toxin-antitoxin system Phd/YefM family antitoxin [Synergistales bacterium]MDY6414822.1 type II toxin-antitoxin system Phd/YefM family antitoxin [Synergistales bacterium]